MIKALTRTELSSSKTRSGLASLEELLPRLIRSYELQAELVERRNQPAPKRPLMPTITDTSNVQSTFSWYE